LSSVQATESDADINRLIESLKGKDINKLISEGLTKIGGASSGPAKPAGKADNKKT
jgi:ribosomal protein L12E/L44/L45/RPP1/RPP2